MNTNPQISGIHHITAIASSAGENLEFYENILGLRMVKQTVNFDDPYTYHLYHGDAHGSPGTILTYFLWENLRGGKPGAGMVTSIAFGVPVQSLDFWKHRIMRFGYQVKEMERFGDPVIRFSDPHGLVLELIGMTNPPETGYWEAGPIARANAIKGFHSATVTLNKLQESKTLLMNLMGMTPIDQENNRYRFKMNDQRAPGHVLDLLIDPKAPSGQQGGGTVHHIAFRTESDESQLYWQSNLRNAGMAVTEIRDRKYFRSIYFHSPERVLFEIATDAPGFTVDESVENFGESLMLPEQYELMRSAIEKQLQPLRAGHAERVFTKTVAGVKS